MTISFVTSSDGCRIAYHTRGNGSPLVFVHGASGDKDSVPELRTALGQRFSVTAYDRRGRSDSTDSSSYDFLKEADDLRAIISTTAQPPIVFGISMGARIALEMLRRPVPLVAMVLFEPPATNQIDTAVVEKLKAVRKELNDNGTEPAVILHSKLFHQRTDQEIAELREDRQNWRLRLDNFPITLREMEAVHRDCLFTADSYQPPSCPVHLMAGDATLPFLDNSAVLVRSLEFVRSHRLPEQNHSAPSNNPDLVFQAFLRCVL